MLPAHGRAQPAGFPNRTVRFIVPFPPGSGPEVVVRLMAESLQRRWAQTVLVEGKPGAGGVIAIDAFKRAAADGHDLLLLDGSNLVLFPHLYRKLAYDPARDFELLTPMFRTPFFFIVSASSRYRSIADLIAQARAAPGKLNYGSWGVGNFAHVGSSMLTTASDTRMEHVIYKDTNQVYIAVASGEIDFALGSLAVVNTLGGRVRALAVAGPRRHPLALDVPTVAESGGPDGIDIVGWTMFAAPKTLPPAVLDRIKSDIDATLAESELQSRLGAFGWETFDLTRADIAPFVARQSAQYGEAIARAKISLD